MGSGLAEEWWMRISTGTLCRAMLHLHGMQVYYLEASLRGRRDCARWQSQTDRDLALSLESPI